MGYTEAFKEQMVKRMLGPPAVSASALSKQVEVIGGEGEGVQPHIADALLDGSRQHASHHLVHLRAGTQQQPSLKAPGRNEVVAGQ